MKILTDIQEIDVDQWNRFVENHPDGKIFHSPSFYKAFMSLCDASSKFIVLVDDDGNVLALSVLVILQSTNRFLSNFTKRAIAMAPPLVRDNNEIYLSEILHAQKKILKTQSVYLETRNVSLHKSQIWSDNQYEEVEHLNIILDITRSTDYLYQNLTSSCRNKIRIAQENGLEFKPVDANIQLKEVYLLLRSVYQRINLPLISYSAFKQAVEVLLNANKLELMAVYSGNKIMSVMLLTKYKKECYSWYMATSRKPEAKGASDLLVWNLICWAKNQGFETFNWGGAGMPNEDYPVRDFKHKFGGDLICDLRYRVVFQSLNYSIASSVFHFYRLFKKRLSRI